MTPIIVVGLGQVGFRVASLLRRLGEQVTVITLDGRAEFLEAVRNSGAQIIEGDARSERVLVESGIATAKALICTSDNDLLNLGIALDAQKLAPSIPIVIRLFDSTIAGPAEAMMGVHRALAISTLSAPAFASEALGASVRGTLAIDGVTYVIAEFAVDSEKTVDGFEFPVITLRRRDGSIQLHPEPNEALAKGDFVEVVCTRDQFLNKSGLHVKEEADSRQRARKWKQFVHTVSPVTALNLMKTIWINAPTTFRSVFVSIIGLALLSIVVFQIGLNLKPLDSAYFVATTLTTTGYGDISSKDASPWVKVYTILLLLLGSASVAMLYSMVTDFIVTSRFDQILGRQKIPESGHVVVAGLGNVGNRTIDALARLQVPVVAIDLSADARPKDLLNDDITLIVGDARDASVLKRAGIEGAKAIVTTSGNDLVNLSAALKAKSLNPNLRTITRIFDADFATKISQREIVDRAMSAARKAAPTFVGSTIYLESLLCYISGDFLIAITPEAKAKSNAKDNQEWTAELGRGVQFRIQVRRLAEED